MLTRNSLKYRLSPVCSLVPVTRPVARMIFELGEKSCTTHRVYFSAFPSVPSRCFTDSCDSCDFWRFHASLHVSDEFLRFVLFSIFLCLNLRRSVHDQHSHHIAQMRFDKLRGCLLAQWTAVHMFFSNFGVGRRWFVHDLDQ